MKHTFILLAVLLCTKSFSQIIPSAHRVDWSHAGMKAAIPNPSNIADVKLFGATGNGITNDFPAVQAAITSLGGQMGVVYFPAGNYLLNGTINLQDSIIIRGAGADSTTLTFDLGNTINNCFNIGKGQSLSFTPVISGFQKDSPVIEVANGTLFQPGDHAEIRQDNGAWDTNPASWAGYSVGQMVTVDSVSGNFLYISQPLRMDFDTSLNLAVSKTTPASYVGLECFKFTRIDSTTTSVNYGVYYFYAADCWMRGVESYKSIGAHVWAESSTNLQITGCYFHESYIYDGNNTKGYGVILGVHSGDCLIENNIFRHLRHSMMVKQGANGNVFGYNYSFEPTRTEFPTDAGGDISLHGHFPFANLFEGNIVQNLFIDQSWGPSGPFNTFFRNRVELYGINMTSGTINSNDQNFVGNDVPNPGAFMGLYLLTGTGNFEHGNNIKGTIKPPGTSVLNDTSYYLSGTPSFWNITYAYPNIGTPNSTTNQSIPARERFLSGAGFTLCGEDTASSVSIYSISSEIAFKVFPNPFDKIIVAELFSFSDQKVKLNLHNTLGKSILSKQITLHNGSNSVEWNTGKNIIPGIYMLSAEYEHGITKTMRLIKL